MQPPDYGKAIQHYVSGLALLTIGAVPIAALAESTMSR